MPLGYFTDSTPLTPLRDPFNVLVDGINSIASTREIQTFHWADATARAAQTGMVAGDQGFQQDNQSQWTYSSAIPGGSPAGWYPASGSAIASILGGGNATSGSSTTVLGSATIYEPVTDVLDVGTNAITAKMAGWYDLSVITGWSSNNSGSRVIEAQVNGSPVSPGPLLVRQSANSATGQSLSSSIYLSANDVVRVAHIQDSGTTLAYSTRLTLKFIRPGSPLA